MAGTHLSMAVDDRDVRAEMARHAQPPDGSLAAQLGEYLQASTQDRFKAQAAPDGTPWAPLSKRYQRRKKYNADKVLTLRGYLRSGIHYQKLDVNSVAVGTNSPYGGIHQFGGSIQQPARQATVRFSQRGGPRAVRRPQAQARHRAASQHRGTHHHHAGATVPGHQPGRCRRDPPDRAGLDTRRAALAPLRSCPGSQDFTSAAADHGGMPSPNTLAPL